MGRQTHRGGFFKALAPVQDDTTLLSITKKFLTETSAHGIQRVPNEKYSFAKLIWLLIFFGACGYFVIQANNLINMYRAHDVGVRSGYQYRDLAQFPAVTLCNMNKLKRSTLNGTKFSDILRVDNDFRRTYAEEELSNYYYYYYDDDFDGSGEDDVAFDYDYDYDGFSAGDDYEVEPFSFDDSEVYSGLKSEYDYSKMLALAKTSDLSDIQDMLRPTQEELAVHGHRKEDLIWQCSFDRRDCDIKKVFIDSYSGLYGRCYTFNSALGPNPVLNTTRYGSRYGLRLTLNIEAKEYLGMFTQEMGVRVVVHDNDVIAFPEDAGINAPIGRSTEVSVSTTRLTRESAPYKTNCTSGDSMALHYNGIYTIENCLLTCLRDHLKAQCGCVDTVDISPGERICSFANISEVYCRQKVYYKYRIGTLGCRGNCRDACQETKYDTGVSYSIWPNEAYSYLMLSKLRNSTERSNLTLSYLTDNLLRVHVYFEGLSLHVIEEYPAYTWDRLLADVGGTLGLFLGVSCCTVLEFVEYGIWIIAHIVTLCCCRRKNHPDAVKMRVVPAEELCLEPKSLRAL